MTRDFSTQSSTVRFVCRQLGTGCLRSGTPNRPNLQGFAVALLQKQDIQLATGFTVEEKQQMASVNCSYVHKLRNSATGM
ncbi:MAG: hypothetical protein KME19_17220 [Microcoleus vaginatus WJT46-NPBG5]|jgi:hypothetical protein|nr:hypothetical protein [Microcoleus vaginatus WJT46-NPBG5]